MLRHCRPLLLLVILPLAHASPDYQALSSGVVEHYLLPHYRVLTQALDEQHAALTDFCETPGRPTLSAAREGFHGAMDAWQGIQHINTGPIQLLFRRDRINHWPERRNAVERGLRAVLNAADPDALAPERLADASVAVQGLPALERLLFAQDTLDVLTAATPEAAYRCALMVAVSANLMVIGHGVVEEWENDVLPILGAGEPHPLYFRDAKDLSARLLTDLQSLLEVMIALKLEPVLGESADTARPLQVENRRSGRGSRNLRLNLQAARRMVGEADGKGFGGALADADPRVYQALVDAFDAASQAGEAIPEPLTEVLTSPAERPRVVAFLVAMRNLRALFRERVPEALGLSLGFNAMDGD